jgi:hypothetical protein
MMYSENEIELTAEERALLGALPRTKQPSDLLEERVVGALRREGHLGSAPPRRRTSALVDVLRIAAAIALFAGGVATGRYLMAGDAPQSASAQQQQDVAPPQNTRQVESSPANGETVVAEREIWM